MFLSIQINYIQRKKVLKINNSVYLKTFKTSYEIPKIFCNIYFIRYYFFLFFLFFFWIFNEIIIFN